MNYLFEGEKQTVKIISNLKNDIFDYDEREIKRVLINLIANASEYSPSGSNIFITLDEDCLHLVLTIQDEGSGISQEQLQSMFDENQTFKPRFKKVGSGMGIYITKKIMEAHNGNILVESKPGLGSKFTLLIPIEKSCTVETN